PGPKSCHECQTGARFSSCEFGKAFAATCSQDRHDPYPPRACGSQHSAEPTQPACRARRALQVAPERLHHSAGALPRDRSSLVPQVLTYLERRRRFTRCVLVHARTQDCPGPSPPSRNHRSSILTSQTSPQAVLQTDPTSQTRNPDDRKISAGSNPYSSRAPHEGGAQRTRISRTDGGWSPSWLGNARPKLD